MRSIIVGVTLASLLPVASAAAPPVAGGAGSVFPTGATQTGQKLALLATACWMGGLWVDAEGAEQKRQAAEAHCRDVVKSVWGRDDRVQTEKLRSLDRGAVADVVAKVRATAAGALAGDLARMVDAVAEVERENMYGRRAADKVKNDVETERPGAKLSKDETEAVNALRAHAALEVLLTMKLGGLTRDVHAIALLAAMDRVEYARGLPKSLKLLAVCDTFSLVFGAKLPTLPRDPRAPLPPGEFLTYLVTVAESAHHAQPAARDLTPRQRETYAWAGMLAGFADQLRFDAGGLSAGAVPELSRVVAATIARLDSEYAVDQNAAWSAGRTN